MSHSSKNEFKTVDWLRVKDRFSQAIHSTVRYFTNQCPSYVNDVFESTCLNELSARNSYLKLI